MSQTATTNSDELHDKVFIFKVFNNPGLLESLKSINQHQVYLDLKNFCSEEIKVFCFLYDFSCQLFSKVTKHVIVY